MLDLDGGGTIEEEELRVGLQSVGKDPTDDEMAKMMHEVDEDDSGEIDPAEFVQFMVNMRKKDREEAERKKGLEEQALKLEGEEDTDDEGMSPDTSISPVSNGLLPAPPGGKTATSLQVSALTPVKSAATVGPEQNFGLPLLQSPSNENWLEMTLERGKSMKKILPKITAKGAKIAP